MIANRSNSLTFKNLCVYQDEAVGASPVPLTIRGKNFHVNKSSEYFAKTGIRIDLQLSSSNEILQIQMGPDICVDLKTLKAGLEVGPFGLFPVHVIQIDQKFDWQNGGILRFGFLKEIFVLKTLKFCLRRIFTKMFPSISDHLSVDETDLSQKCRNYFGDSHWGTYDIVIKKDAIGNWALFQSSSVDQVKAIERLIARFNVNKNGVVLGIQEMYCV